MFNNLSIIVSILMALVFLTGCSGTQSATSIDVPSDTPIPSTLPPPTNTQPHLSITPEALTDTPTAVPPSATPRPTSTPTPPPTITFPDEVSELNDMLTRPGDGIRMVYVPGGTFEMGSIPDDDSWGPHTVTLDGFWIDQTEVTNAQFAAFLNARGNHLEGGVPWLEIEQMENAQIEIKNGIFQPEDGKDNHPVVEVSSFGISAYCEWVGARLPTEAEWEYAARGPENRVYPWGNDPPTCELAQFGGCGDYSVPVGSLSDEGDSWVGAKDMAGNVWEWTADYYAPYPSEPQVNPTGPETGEWLKKIVRGGSYLSAPDTLHTAYRRPGGGNQPNQGFRCAASAPNSSGSPTALPPLSGSGSGVIAFFSNREGNDEIYVMNADGSDQRNLTNHPFSDTDPAWSPDGSQIAFASTRDRNYEIYVMDADGSNIRRLTNHSAVDVDPTWSPDSSQIAFLSLRDGNVEIYLINVDGSGLQRVTHNAYDDFEINWSPDGKLIAIASQIGEFVNIYTIDIEAALQGPLKRNQLTDTQAHDGFPKWSPDGSRIAFISNREGDENWEIYVMDADGSKQRRLTYSEGLDGISTWSPDGTQIAFESNRDGDNDIYILNVAEALQNPEGIEILRLTDNDINDQQPVWRPEQPKIEPELSIEVPAGSAPVINGRLSDGEWDGPRVVPLTGGGELHLIHADGYLFLGIRAEEHGIGSVCHYQNGTISIMHASAGLGTFIYEQGEDTWESVTQFFGCCMDLPQTMRGDAQLKEQGWVANLVQKGEPNEMEYQIALGEGDLMLAVTYILVDSPTFVWWPEGLDDDCGRMELVDEVPDISRLQFAPETRVKIIPVEK